MIPIYLLSNIPEVLSKLVVLLILPFLIFLLFLVQADGARDPIMKSKYRRKAFWVVIITFFLVFVGAVYFFIQNPG